MRTELIDRGKNDVALSLELDFADERREAAVVRLTSYQQRLSKAFNQNVRERKFVVGELVLKKLLPGDKDPTQGKLAPNWHGPFRVTANAGQSSYRLEDMEGNPLPRPWNASHLKKFYF